jgi:hypothetical protein
VGSLLQPAAGRVRIGLLALACVMAAVSTGATGVRESASDGDLETIVDRPVPALSAGPAVGAWGVHVAVAWIEGPIATSPVRALLSRDGGRRFGSVLTLPSLGVTGPPAALAVAIGAPRSGGPAEPRVLVGMPPEGGGRGGAVVSADGGRRFDRMPWSAEVAEEMAAARWQVERAPATDGIYHAMPPPSITRRGPLVIAQPAALAAAPPVVTFDAHQVLAVVWREQPQILIIRRHATSWGAGSPFRTRPFDLPVRLTADGPITALGVVPAATGIAVVTGVQVRDGARVRVVRVPVSVLCAPPARPLA